MATPKPRTRNLLAANDVRAFFFRQAFQDTIPLAIVAIVDMASHVHSLDALRSIHRKSCAKYSVEGDRIDAEEHLLRQARICHAQSESIVRLGKLLTDAEAILQQGHADAPADLEERCDTIESLCQPYPLRPPRPDEPFEVRFQVPSKIAKTAGAPPPPTAFVRRKSLQGASHRFGNGSLKSQDRHRRWLPVFVALDKVESSLAALEDASWDTNDQAAPQAISEADKTDALAEGFEDEAVELSTFLRRWGEVLATRASIVTLQRNIARTTRSTDMPSRAVQVGEPGIDRAIVSQDSAPTAAENGKPSELSTSASSEEQDAVDVTPFSAIRGTKHRRAPFEWIRGVKNQSYLRQAERTCAATRIQAAFRGAICRRVTGNVVLGIRTPFASRNSAVAKCWLEAGVGRGRRGSDPSLVTTVTNLLSGWCGVCSTLNCSFADFAMQHFAASLQTPAQRWQALGDFIDDVHRTQRSDPLFALAFMLLMGDLSREKESIACQIVVSLVKTYQPHATLEMLPLDLSEPQKIVPGQAMKGFARACATFTGNTPATCLRRLWRTTDVLLPSWTQNSDASLHKAVDRALFRELATPVESSSSERPLTRRQLLLVAVLTFCVQ